MATFWNSSWVGSMALMGLGLAGLYALKLSALRIHEAARRARLLPRTPGDQSGLAVERWEQIRRYVANEVTLSGRSGAENHGN